MGNIIEEVVLKNNNIKYDIGAIKAVDSLSSADFSVSDNNGNAIVELENGDIKTKNFDSRYAPKQDNGNTDDAFSIYDEEQKAVVAFSKGHIKTKNFNSETYKPNVVNVRFEIGGIDTQGIEEYNYNTFMDNLKSSFFINTGNADGFYSEEDLYCFQYDINHTFIKFSLATKNIYFNLNSSCKYVRFTKRNNGSIDKRVSISFINCDYSPAEEKKVQMRTPSERLVFEVREGLYTTALLKLPPNYSVEGAKVPLILQDGADGSFVYWGNYEMGGSYAGVVNGLNYMRDSGFAVLEIYSWCSYYYSKYQTCGNRGAMPIPTHIDAHVKGVDYVLERYNIDSENIFEMSWSGSGKLSLHYATEKQPFNLKAVYAFAPVFDDLNFLGIGSRDYRRALLEELNLQGTELELQTFYNGNTVAEGSKTGQGWLLGYNTDYTDLPEDSQVLQDTIAANRAFVEKNAEKFSHWSVSWKKLIGQTLQQKIQDTYTFGRAFWDAAHAGHPGSAATGESCYTRHNMTMIGGGAPITVIMCKDDTSTPYWSALEVVNQLRNGGNCAKIITYDSGGHSGPCNSTSGSLYVSDVTTKLGIHYDGVSIGWKIAADDIFARFVR